MNTGYYLDANSMVSWALSKITNAEPRDVKIGTVVEQLIADKQSDVAVSEVTIGEFQSKACIRWRDDQPSAAAYNATWFDMVQELWLGWTMGGRLVVLAPPPRALEKALVYITSATRDHKRNFRIWDAMHLGYASHWARERSASVNLVTSDTDFAKLFSVFPEFNRFVTLLDPATDPL